MKVTEQSSLYSNLDTMSTADLLKNMNNEDKKVPYAVENCIPQIEKLVDGIVESSRDAGSTPATSTIWRRGEPR